MWPFIRLPQKLPFCLLQTFHRKHFLIPFSSIPTLKKMANFAIYGPEDRGIEIPKLQG
jgi:hypothetical protein